MSRPEMGALAAGVRASLATLLDVAGITGSFVCTQSGRLVAREIPALFDDGVLEEAGSRLLRVGETFAAGGDELDAAVVRYGDHRLYLKSIAGGLLCIVVSGTVNMPALRMAANLVGRRIAPAVSRAQEELPPLPAQPRPDTVATLAEQPPAMPAQPTPDTAAVRPPARPSREAPPGMRRFRGRALE